MLKILRVLRFDKKNIRLNINFWSSQYLNMIFTEPWNLHNIARSRLKSEKFGSTLQPQFASLQRIAVLSTRKLILSLLRP